jgi:hypothetical protein
MLETLLVCDGQPGVGRGVLIIWLEGVHDWGIIGNVSTISIVLIVLFQIMSAVDGCFIVTDIGW